MSDRFPRASFATLFDGRQTWSFSADARAEAGPIFTLADWQGSPASGAADHAGAGLGYDASLSAPSDASLSDLSSTDDVAVPGDLFPQWNSDDGFRFSDSTPMSGLWDAAADGWNARQPAGPDLSSPAGSEGQSADVGELGSGVTAPAVFGTGSWAGQQIASAAGADVPQPVDPVSPALGIVVSSGDDDSFPLAGLDAVDAGTGTGGAGSAKPVPTIPQLASYLVTGFWQYNDTIAHHWASTTISYNVNGLTSAEQFLAQSALEAWHEVTNLTFVATTGSANITFNHNGSMTAFETDNYNGAGIMSSATVDVSADWITTDGGAQDGKTGIDSYGYQTYIHEIGHALGLGHQGPYNGSASYSTDATYADDTWQYSVMSYFSENNYNGGSYRYVITPQMADIYAVDSIYGAATTRIGDTVYGFHDTAGSIFNFASYTQAPALTIYDSGGNDTLDCSGYSVAQTIDLHAGAFSSVGGLVHNIGIATNTNIENAIGGSGNDTLIANDNGCTLQGGAGNDTLIGGAGADRLVGGVGVDTMTGGGGADIFAFSTGDSAAASGQHDLITDFISGADKIDLTGIDADVSSPGVVNAFRFVATSAFDGVAGALDYTFDSVRGVTVLSGDVNGDRVADFSIDLTGNLVLTSSDFTAGSVRPVAPLTLTGGSGNDTLTGDIMNDTLSGGGGNDVLIGLAGDDILDGGAGADTMIGGAGNDTYYVDNPGDVVTEASSFTAPTGWTVKGTADVNGDGQLDAVATDGTNNQLWILNNGVISSSTNLIQSIGGRWTLEGVADVNGDGIKDALFLYQDGSLECAYSLNGTPQFLGYFTGKVADTMQALQGNQGTDTVISTITCTLPNGVENLTLASGAGNINGTGNAASNVIIGNEGNNILAGGAGVDTLTGNGGADIFVFSGGDTGSTSGHRDTVTDFVPGVDKLDLTGIDADTTSAGHDAFHFLGAAAFDGQAGALHAVFDSAHNVTVVEGDTNGDGIADFGIELTGNLSLTSNDFSAGSLVAPLDLIGTAGNDTLVGGKLNDILDGGAGADTMIGGAGNDTYYVDNPGDVVTEASSFTAPTGWTVKGTADVNGDGQLDAVATDGTNNQLWILNNGVISSSTNLIQSIGGRWTLEGVADVNGDGIKDALFLYQDGSLECAYSLNGTPQFLGYFTGKVADTMQALQGNQGTDTVISTITYTLPNGVENLTLASGAGNINGTGNAASNVIIGNEGNNILAGGAGVDTLTGNGGADIFVFSGGDTGSTSGHRDTVTDFVPGVDKLDLTGIDADTTSAGHDAFHFLGAAAFDGQAGALHAVFDSAHNVTVVEGDTNGDGIADFGIELTGNLSLTSNDFSAGSLVAPLDLIGTAGNDTLVGGKLNDILDGGAGADTMIGGAGNDTYYVDNPGDVVTEASSFTAPTGWTVKGTADVNGDGQLDAVATDGTNNQLWILNNGVISSSTNLIQSIGGRWTLEGVADVNGDGIKDALFLYQDGSLECAYSLNGTPQFLGYFTGKVADTMQALQGNQGTDTVISTITYTLPNGVENLTLASGAGNINGTGNAASNVIIGNEGNNVLTGGAGADTFVFKPAFGRDAVTDYQAGQDVLQFDHTTFTAAADVMSHAANDGHGNVVITADPNDVVTIQNTTVAMLNQHLSDFHIV